MDTSSNQKSGFWLWHTALAWRLQLSRNLEPLQLTAPQFFALGALNALQTSGPESVAHGTIAQHAGLDPMMTSRILQKLEDAHLVTRSVDPNDKRRQLFQVTKQGHELADRATAIAVKTDESFFKNIPAEFVTILQNLYPAKGVRDAHDHKNS